MEGESCKGSNMGLTEGPLDIGLLLPVYKSPWFNRIEWKKAKSALEQYFLKEGKSIEKKPKRTIFH